MKYSLLAIAILLQSSIVGQNIDLLGGQNNLELINVVNEISVIDGIEALKVQPEDVESEAKFVRLKNLTFYNGTIDIDVVGKRASSAGSAARGFVGIAFRINDDNSRFECFYIRPTNGRSDDQLRRNHSVQYISYPDYPWHRLRKETPGKYETYSDLVEGQWTHLKIEVDGDRARLYIGNAEQPSLLVNDLKLGPEAGGALGLWVGPGTEAYFSGLKVVNK